MAQYTINTTAQEDVILTFLLNNVVNPQRVAQDLPTITLNQLVNGLFDRALSDAKNQQTGFTNSDRAQKFTDAAQAIKDQVDTLLGTLRP